MSTPTMEVLMTEDFYVIVDNQHSLWCNRVDGTITPRIDADIKSLHEPVCLGMVFGVIGKIQAHQDLEKKLVLIKQQGIVGRLPGNHETYKIQKIALLPLSQHELLDLELENCKHHNNPRKSEKTTPSEGLQKTWNSIKTATSQVKPRKKDFAKDREKFDKRISDELYKMFNDTDSFYYSLTGDVTNSLQRQYNQSQEIREKPLWARVDERFFWNRHMLSDLIELNQPEADFWITPVIQGYVQIERCWIDIVDDLDLTPLHDAGAGPIEVKQPDPTQQQGREYTMILISRRSRYRAGTRYKRRGVDESGKCANYVETEQIFEYPPHVVSFVQVRGSVPVFWSQPGYKYRPPPRLDKGEDETQTAFEKHFEEEVSVYKSVVIVNLVEQIGKEKVISDAYINHILRYDCPSLIYVTFDFHEYCRGMKFENVSVLIESIKDLVRDIRYCWVDSEGLICDQQGTFRVNCIDCLDRTNIVQTALAKTVMDIQFVRLGLIPPEGILPAGCRRVFQIMWANNGDIISRQYAGTAALKGDFTRTGERRIAGVMKDGYNSASRYYVNRFKDAYRQATIDLMLGNPITEDISAVSPEREEAEHDLELSEMEHHERVKQLIEDCKKILIPESETVLGGWALIDADPVTGDPNQHDMDTILVLTKESYYVAEYDDETDRITRYQRVLLEDLERIELGPEPSIFKSKRHCLRLHYLANGLSGFFQMFRSTNTRFFNNMAVPIKNDEEAAESLKAICEAFKVALSVKSLNVPFFEGRLERRRSKLPLAQGSIHGNTGGYRASRSHLVSFHLELPSLSSMPRNISEGQLVNLRNVGSRAMSNMTSQIAKLNPIRGIRNLSKRGNGNASQGGMLAAVSETGLTTFHMDSSSDSEDDSLRKVKKHGLGVVVTNSGNFIHHISDRTLSSDYSECSDIDEHEFVMISDSLENDEESFVGSQDKLLESCGILATSPGLSSIHGGSRDSLNQVVRAKSVEGTHRIHHYHKHGHHRHPYHHRRYQNCPDVDDFVLDAMKKASLRSYRRRKASSTSASTHSLTSTSSTRAQQMAPAIQISCENLSTTGASQSSSRLLTVEDIVGRAGRKLSKSSEDLEVRSTVNLACSSNEVSHLLVHEENIPLDAAESLTAKMKTSHSESAIQDFSFPSLNLPNPLASPIVIKKDLVLSPLSRIAKGVQNLGMNLRPNRNQQNMTPEEYEKLKERRKNCKTRIIDL